MSTNQNYTWVEVENDWLRGAYIGVASDEVTTAFNKAVAVLGRDWVEGSRRASGSPVYGSIPTLWVAIVGQVLDSLDDAANCDLLISKLRNDLPDAHAELQAIYLLRHNRANIQVEYEPNVIVGTHNRKPDFRARNDTEPWLYVEVTRPSTSIARREMLEGLSRISSVTDRTRGSYAVEVLLNRDPRADEIELITNRIAESCNLPLQEVEVLPEELGTLHWNERTPGDVQISDRNQDYTPRSGVIRVASDADGARQVNVRWPFTDDRASKFLKHEAQQLPSNAPGLIMIHTSDTPGAMTEWPAVLARRLQPDLHRRVSGICLYSVGSLLGGDGEPWGFHTRLISNPHAQHPLPAWVVEQVESAPQLGI